MIWVPIKQDGIFTKYGYQEKKPYIIDGQRVTLEEYRKTKYEDLRVRVPKGKKEEIKKFVASTGKSLNAFINEAIDEKIEREKQ